jgi:hypothetical protein
MTRHALEAAAREGASGARARKVQMNASPEFRTADGALEQATSVFARVRPRLFGIAYRMLGSVTEAEDVLQDTWLRWQDADRPAIANPPAFLALITTRLAINISKSARLQRETCIGHWLPEPINTGTDPAVGAERGEALELALLLLPDPIHAGTGQPHTCSFRMPFLVARAGGAKTLDSAVHREPVTAGAKPRLSALSPRDRCEPRDLSREAPGSDQTPFRRPLSSTLKTKQSVGATSDDQRSAVADPRPCSVDDRGAGVSPERTAFTRANVDMSTMNLHWTESASCISLDSDLFFPLGDEAVHADQIAAIRRICATCPAARRCLEWALTTGEPEGIWAGTTPSERRRLRAARKAPSAAVTDPRESAVIAAGSHPRSADDRSAMPRPEP